MKFVKQNLTDLDGFLCDSARQHQHFAISSSRTNAISSALSSLIAASAGDNSNIAIVVALDHYRLKVIQTTLDNLRDGFTIDDALTSSPKIATCTQLESHFRTSPATDHASLPNCWRILLVLNEADPGSLGLAYFEWIIDNVVGNAVPITYLLPSNYVSQPIILWLKKRGITAINQFNDHDDTVKRPNIIYTDQNFDHINFQNSLIFSQVRTELDSIAEHIHKKGGKSHAYYNDGVTRGAFKKTDSALSCLPGFDKLPPRKWEHCFCIAPHSASYLHACLGAIHTNNSNLIARTHAELFACMALASSQDNDLETLLPGPFSRAILGAYETYRCLQQNIPLSTHHITYTNRFLAETVPQLINFWNELGFIDHTCNGSLVLSEKGKMITAGYTDPNLFAKHWEHSRFIACVDPNGELLQLESPLKLAFNRSKTIKIGNLCFESAINEFSSNGTWMLRRSSSDRRAPWNDTSGAIFGHEAAMALHALLQAKEQNPHLFSLDEASLAVLKAYQDTFRDVLHAKSISVIETADARVKWWTFGGGIINATLTSALLLNPQAFDVRFSNCAIEFSIRQKDVDNAPLILSIINNAISICLNPTDDQLTDITKTWFWIPGVSRWFELLGITWQKAYINNVLLKQRSVISQMGTTVLSSVQTLHVLMEEPYKVPPQTSEQSPKKTYRSAEFQASTPKTSPFSENSTAADLPKFADGYYRLGCGDGSQMHTHLPWHLINTDAALNDAVNVMMKEPFIGLDVETTLFDQKLCFVQIGCKERTFLIDPLMVSIFPLVQVLTNPRIIKVIHNKTFECTVLGKLGIQICNIIDTCAVSRKIHGAKDFSGNRISHKLSAVCLREFNYTMDKTNQTSRWEVRPLSDSQLEYAALDAEILVHLYHHYFMSSK